MSQELEGTLTNSANLVGTFGSEGGGGTTNYNDLINKPSINSVTLQGNKTASQLGFANVATSGSYDDLTNKPSIPAAQVNSDWNAVSGVAEILNKPTLAAVATSGAYSDLTGTPTIPAAQVNSDWNATSGVAEILNKPTVYQNAAALPISSTDTTDTKSYIDTGLSGKQDALSNQTITLTPSTNVLGSFTGACYQYGKVVCLFVQTASPTSEVAYQSIFLTGLPKPVYANDNNRVSLTDRATNKTYRFRITDSGQLQEWFNSSGKIPSGADLYGTIVYLAE